jgi:hypothetical protein
MLTNLKRILLTQYIGAIITAYLAVQGILGLITIVVYIISVFLQPRETGLFSSLNGRTGVDLNRIVPELLRAILQIAVAGGFTWWLYVERKLRPEATPALDEDGDDESDEQEPGESR